jgi:exodeoxyribonuclease V gamma subunit
MRADMLTLITSNSTDALADALAQAQALARLHPLANTTLVVPSLAHSRWVRQALALRLGAAASIKATFPAQFIWQLTAAQLAHVPGVERAAPVPGEQLRWWVYDWLSRVANDAQDVPAQAREMLRALAQNEAERFKLAARLARLLGDYWVYRPQWLLAWQDGRIGRGEPASVHAAWQRALWQFVAQQTGLVGKRHPFELLAAQLRQSAVEDLPKRIVLFGVASMAPLYLQVFAELAQYTEVELYSLSPSEAYWGDVQDARALHRSPSLASIEDFTADDEADEFNEDATLLAAWGKNARDFHAALVSLNDAPQVQDAPCFVAVEEHSALSQLKREWLELQAQLQWEIDAHDRSIRIHGCTSLQRQVEALHDDLAHAFAADASLSPGDIAVLVMDIEQAAPHIHAVFGAHADRPLPYRITGLPDRASEVFANALRSLLHMGQGREASALARFEASAVLQWLRVPPVAARFGFTVAELELITHWVQRLNVRNGYGDEPASLALSPAHSWRAGLARLHALAEALSGDEARMIPSWMSGPQAQDLATRLSSALAQLAVYRDRLHTPRPLAAWQGTLQHILTECFDAGADEQAARWLLEACEIVSALAQNLPAPMRAMPMSVAVVSRLIDDALRTRAPGAVPSGAVTFAQLGELRGLPYRHIVLLGIEQGSFTQREPKLEFDLMAAKPRKGDRARQSDEIGALLDAVLAARDRVSFYTHARDAQTGEPLPLAAALQTLLELLRARTRDMKRQHMWLQERAVQRFSSTSFNAPEPSYSIEYITACEHNMPARDSDLSRVSDISGIISEPASTDDFARFIADPAAEQLRQRFDVRFRDDDDEVPNDEPTVLRGLEAWDLNRQLSDGADTASNTLAAALPPGIVGEAALREARVKVAPFVAACERLSERNASLHRAQYRQLKLRDLAWLGLVQAERALLGEGESEAIVVGSEQVLLMSPLSLEAAQSLMRTWQSAWSRDALIAPWLPTDTTWAWAEAQCKTKRGDALEAARKAWINEREKPMWQCLLEHASDTALEELSGWQAQAEACFSALLPQVRLLKLTAWLNADE